MIVNAVANLFEEGSVIFNMRVDEFQIGIEYDKTMLNGAHWESIKEPLKEVFRLGILSEGLLLKVFPEECRIEFETKLNDRKNISASLSSKYEDDYGYLNDFYTNTKSPFNIDINVEEAIEIVTIFEDTLK